MCRCMNTTLGIGPHHTEYAVQVQRFGVRGSIPIYALWLCPGPCLGPHWPPATLDYAAQMQLLVLGVGACAAFALRRLGALFGSLPGFHHMCTVNTPLGHPWRRPCNPCGLLVSPSLWLPLPFRDPYRMLYKRRALQTITGAVQFAAALQGPLKRRSSTEVVKHHLNA